MALGISMIMSTNDTSIPAADIHRQLAKYWPDLPAPSDTEDKGEIVSFQIGEASVIIAKMPAPIPWSQLEGPCETSVLWKNAVAEVKQHTIHWIVTVNAELAPLELSKRLTQVTAATLAASPAAIGVYWGNATLIIPKAIFVDFAKDVLPHGPPLHIWVDFQIGRDSETSSSGFTAGMKALGHMELEAKKSPEPPGELHDRLTGLANYLLENGPVIQDGDTIGEDAQERIRIVYSDSAFGHKEKVMRLVYEATSPKKPWWKLWS